MPLGLIFCFSLGVFLPAFFPVLPSVLFLLGISAVALAVARWRYCRTLTAVLLGVLWGCIWGHWQLQGQLPLVQDKTDYWVTGTIRGLPETDNRRVRFVFDVESIEPLEAFASPPQLKKLLLSWYQPRRDSVNSSAFATGDRWHLKVRLRTPRGFANPGGFDYSQWLFGQGISATGYVRSSADNRQLVANAGFSTDINISVDSLRLTIRQRIDQLPLPADIRAYIAALTIGDKSGFSSQQWDLLQSTGTIHLMVVSGLHIGMVAGVGMIIGQLLGRLLLLVGVGIPARLWGGVLGLLLATLYSLLAGFTLPTQRALVMVAVFMLALLCRRRIGVMTGIVWALAAISVIDPLAVLRPGFWLSFMAVFGLLWWFLPRPKSRWRLVTAQGIVFLFLAPWLLLFLGDVPLVAPLINLLVIPWISFTVIPLCLLGALMVAVGPVSDGLWLLAGHQLVWFERGLNYILALAGDATWHYSTNNAGLMVAGFFLVAILFLLPRGIPGRALGVVLLLALLWVKPVPPEGITVTVLDVGQGMAVVVRVAGKTLVYDTGPYYSSRFDAGSGIIAPYLRSLGVTRVDRLIVSHGDSDHAGGVSGLLKEMAVADAISGEPEVVKKPGMPVDLCQSGDHWRWGKTRFDILGPGAGGSQDGNNLSCVLLIRHFTENGAVTILLPGDIEADAEAQLQLPSNMLAEAALDAEVLDEEALSEKAQKTLDLLLAPHHGSKTSSSNVFVTRMNPANVVYSAGYNHHFGHPHPEVVSRYQAIEARQWHTAQSGALIFSWDSLGQLTVKEYRQEYRRYWHEG